MIQKIPKSYTPREIFWWHVWNHPKLVYRDIVLTYNLDYKKKKKKITDKGE